MMVGGGIILVQVPPGFSEIVGGDQVARAAGWFPGPAGPASGAAKGSCFGCGKGQVH